MDLNDTQYAKLCQKAQAIANTPGFSMLLILEILLGYMAAVPNIFLAILILRVTVFHINLRIFLAHLSFMLLWYSAAYATKAANMLPVILRGNACTLITNMYECKLLEFASSIPAQGTVYAALSVCAERFYSTVRYKRYDYSDSIKTASFTAALLLPLCYVIPVANTLNSLMKIPRNASMPICENPLSTTSASAATSLTINLVFLALCVFLVGTIWYWNFHKLRSMLANRAKHTLTARFQIDQNVRVNRIMVPSMVLQLACFIPNYVLLFAVLVESPWSDETKLILVHVNYVWKLVYALAHPTLAVMRNEHIRQKCRHVLGPLLKFVGYSKVHAQKCGVGDGKLGLGIKDEAGTKARAAQHFDMLADSWSARGLAKSSSV